MVHPDGYAEIRDRIKDVIISGGENISSLEIEGTLLRHPAVGEAAVVGLPSEKWGETPHAFVVLRPDQPATEAELIAFVRDRIAHYKAPRGVTFVTDLPKTATGKIQKYVLRGGAAVAGAARVGRSPAPPPRPTLDGGATTGDDRSRALDGAQTGDRRRADRQPGLATQPRGACAVGRSLS